MKKITKKAIKLAGQLLSTDSDAETKKQIGLIQNHAEDDDFIDHIDGVDVWEKVQLEFTKREFLEQIGLV